MEDFTHDELLDILHGKNEDSDELDDLARRIGIPEDTIRATKIYTAFAKASLVKMTLLASKSKRPRHAYIWKLLYDLLGPDKNIQKIHDFLALMAKEQKGDKMSDKANDPTTYMDEND